MVENVFADLPRLETERLVLRKLTDDDAAELFVYASDPQVARFVVWHPHQTLEDSRAFIGSVLDAYRRGEVAPWGLEHRQDGRLVGTCGFIAWHAAHRKAEVGYAMARPYWGQGLMAEAVRAVIAFGFERMQLLRVEALCELPNLASARVLEKVGMSQEAILRHYMISKGTPRDLKMYAVLKDEWAG